MEVKSIRALIGSIGKATVKLVKQIQGCAVECLVHAVQHGDVTLADELVEACGKGIRRASLRAWFELNGPFYIPKGKDKFAFDAERAKTLKAEGEAAIRERLAEKLWQDAKPEAPVVSVLDVEAAFDKFLDRLNKQASEAGMTVRHRALLDILNEEVRTWHNEQALKATKYDAEVGTPSKV